MIPWFGLFYLLHPRSCECTDTLTDPWSVCEGDSNKCDFISHSFDFYLIILTFYPQFQLFSHNFDFYLPFWLFISSFLLFISQFLLFVSSFWLFVSSFWLFLLRELFIIRCAKAVLWIVNWWKFHRMQHGLQRIFLLLSLSLIMYSCISAPKVKMITWTLLWMLLWRLCLMWRV